MPDRSREVRIRRLKPRDDRTGFHSRNIDPDRLFQRCAGQNRFRHHIGTTHVAAHGNRIAGFFTVASGETVGEKLAKGLRRRPF